MVINYWYLADCKWCLCQGVKCLQFLSSRLPIGSFPHLVLNLKPNCEEEAVSCWGLSVQLWIRRHLRTKRFMALITVQHTCPTDFYICFFIIFHLQHSDIIKSLKCSCNSAINHMVNHFPFPRDVGAIQEEKSPPPDMKTVIKTLWQKKVHIMHVMCK